MLNPSTTVWSCSPGMSSQPEKMVCRGLGGSEGCGGVGGVGVGLWHELARFNNLYCMYKYHKAFPNCPYFFFNLATWEYFNNCSIWWRFRKRSTYLSDAYASDGGWGIKKFFKKNYDNSVFKQWNARARKKKKDFIMWRGEGKCYDFIKRESQRLKDTVR